MDNQNHPHQMVGSPPRKSPLPAPMPQQTPPVLMGNMLPGMMPMVPPMIPMMGLPGGVGMPPHPSLSPHHIQQMVNQPLYPPQVAANLQQQYGMAAPVPTVQPQALPSGAPGFPRSNSNSAPAVPPRPSSQNAAVSPPITEPVYSQPPQVAPSPTPDRPEHRKRKPTTDDYEEEREPAPRQEEQFRNVRQRPAMMPRETIERIARHSDLQPPSQPQPQPQPAAEASAMDTDAPPAGSGKAESKDTEEEEESATTEEIGMVAIYAPGGTLPRLERFEGQLVEIRVPAKFLTNKNREVQTMQLWGTDIYTDDSDAAAILAHVGAVTLRAVPPPSCAGYSAFFRVLPGQEGYVATNRFSYRSRPWASLYQRCSLQFVRAEKQEDASLFRTDVESGAPAGKAEKANGRRNDALGVRTRRGGQRVHVMNYVEKAALKQGARGRRRFIPDVVVLFNSLNEPCLKYSLGLVMDRSVDKSEWTSTRLRHECMYFEADHVTYELAREQPDSKAGTDPSNKFDRYRWSIVKKAALPLPTSKGTLKKDPTHADLPVPVPLPADKVEVLSAGVDWQDIEWAPTHVSIGGSVFTVETVQFKARTV